MRSRILPVCRGLSRPDRSASSIRPSAHAVEAAVLDRLGHVLGRDGAGVREVGDSAGDAEQGVVGAGG
jgi:hypothetical protein